MLEVNGVGEVLPVDVKDKVELLDVDDTEEALPVGEDGIELLNVVDAD